MVGDIIGAVGNIAGTLIGAQAGYKQQQQEQQFNAEQAQINRDYQTGEREATQQFNIDMWNMNNQYNSPAEQLKRLQDAGISPNALFGTGASPYQSSAPTSNPMSGSLAQTGSGLGSSLVNAGANLGLNTANMLKSIAETSSEKYDLYWNKMTEDKRLSLMDSEVEKNWSQIKECLAAAGLADANKDQVLELNKYIAPMKRAELRKMNSELLTLSVKRREALSNARLNNEKALTEKAQRDLIGSQINENDENAYYLAQRGFGLEMQNEFSLITGIPYGTDAFQLAYNLWVRGDGSFQKYIEHFVKPNERSKWKPEDFTYTLEEHNHSYESGSGDLTVLGIENGGAYEHKKDKSSKEKKMSHWRGHDDNAEYLDGQKINFLNPRLEVPKHRRYRSNYRREYFK